MKDRILQNDSDETNELQDLLIKSQTNMLKDDFEFENKGFYLYDAPELKKISSKAIITNDLILINADFFKSVSTDNPNTHSDLKSMTLLQVLAQDKLSDAVHLSEEELLKNLNDSGYTEPAQKIQALLAGTKVNYFLPKQDSEYVKNFSTKVFPELIHEFKKNKNFDKVLGFITQSEKKINSLSEIAYGLLIHQFSGYNMKSRFGVTFQNEDKMAIAKIIGSGENFDNMRRQIFINEFSGVNNMNIGLNETSMPSKHAQTIEGHELSKIVTDYVNNLKTDNIPNANIKNFIFQNINDEAYELQTSLLKANANLLKDNFEFKNKSFYLYDAPELKSISKVAIVTNDLIFINADFFKELGKFVVHGKLPDLVQMDMLMSLVKETIPNVINLSPQELSKVLNNNGYIEPAQKIKDLLAGKRENYNLSIKDINYVESFISKKFPEAIHNFNKTKNLEQLLKFVTKSEKEINSLGSISYAVVIHQFSGYNMMNQFGVVLKNNEKAEITKVLGSGENFTTEMRRILIDEISGTNDIQIGLTEKTIKPKKMKA